MLLKLALFAVNTSGKNLLRRFVPLDDFKKCRNVINVLVALMQLALAKPYGALISLDDSAQR